MAKCESCGEKPKCSSQDFTKTVIEIDNPERLVLLRKVVVPASMGDETEFPPAVGKYSNVILQYEATGTLYIYSSDGIPTKIETAIPQDVLDRIATLETDMDAVELGLSSETDARERKDDELQQEIDDIKNSPDVVDIVATYADLLAYDTSKLGDNDVIRVLQDENHDGESTYYRWNKTTSQWAFVGSVGDYYTKTQVDDLLDGKQDVLTAGENITIEDESGALVISATGGSAVSQTIFYANLSETGTTRHIYKEASFTTAVTAQEIIDANDEGQVILRGTTLANPTAYNDSYLQNAFIMPHNNDYEFVFLDRDSRYEYSVSSVSDTNFYYETSGIQSRLTEGANVQIQNNVISATDTTYSNFTGTDGTAAGTAGLVPAPATTDAGKFLKADGTWDSAGGGSAVTVLTSADYDYPTNNPIGVGLWNLTPGLYSWGESIRVYWQSDKSFTNPGVAQVWPSNSGLTQIMAISNTEGILTKVSSSNGSVASPQYPKSLITSVVQTVGTSQTDVMSQNATTGMIFSDPGTQDRVRIGNTGASNTDSVSIGRSAGASGNEGTAVGKGARANGSGTLALGVAATATQTGAISFPYCNDGGATGVVNFGPYNSSFGYSSTKYRLLTGLYDGQSAHDAATKGQLDGRILTNAGAPTTATVGTVGQLLEDTTNGDLYICTAIVPGTDPDPDTYTWEEVGGATIATINSTDWSALWQ